MPKFTDDVEINLLKFDRKEAKIEFIIKDMDKVNQYIIEINGQLRNK